MTTALFIHRRVKPIHDALLERGFNIVYYTYDGDGDDSEEYRAEWERKYGISRFAVKFANGTKLTFIDYKMQGNDPGWEIGSQQEGVSSWFPPGNVYETDGLTLWRFDMEDLLQCVNSFETLAMQFGKGTQTTK